MSKKETLYPYESEGINLYEYVTINGIKQYIQIRGVKKTNPLMLFIHGGPGGAVSGLSHVMQKTWEEKFTVVNFDQRNAGKTYMANKEKATEIGNTGTISDYIRDIEEIIKYLHTIYEFEKLYIMGFSWGSIIGNEYAKAHPENVAAYIGVGQLINYEKSFKAMCEKAKKIAEEKGATKDAAALESIITTYPAEPVMTKERMKSIRTYSMLASKYMVKHAKAFPVMSVLTSPLMNFSEKMGMFSSNPDLFAGSYRTMFTYDFSQNMNFEVPVYFIYGEEDINCPAEAMDVFFDFINAPEKKIYKIKNASHMCFYDNRDAFDNILFGLEL